MPVNGEIVLFGVKDTKKALKEFAPDVLKQMNAEIKGVLNSVTGLAKTYIPDAPPMRGWREVSAQNGRARSGAGWPAWNSGEAKKMIKPKIGGRPRQKGSVWSDAYSIIQNSAAGSIYELAGRRSNGNGTGVQFINNLNKISHASRALWKALDERGERETQVAILDALKKAEAELEARLAAANDREVAS